MSTTTIPLQEDLKARVAAAAERTEKSSHAFILDPIAQTVEQSDLDEEFPATGRPCRGRKQDLISRLDHAGSVRASGGTQAGSLTGPMARIELAPDDFDDFERFLDHIARFEVDSAPDRIGAILQALQILTTGALIGGPVKGGKRELVIGQASRGYIALYRYLAEIDTAFILAIRSQRDSDYKRKR
jgi:toxin ParE1/3/4